MNVKISFHNMPHSTALENHALAKLEKVKDLFKHSNSDQPLFVELFLNAQAAHAGHHSVEVHVKTNNFNVTAQKEGTDMYVVADEAIATIVQLLKKQKTKLKDKKQTVLTEKVAFSRS